MEPIALVDILPVIAAQVRGGEPAGVRIARVNTDSRSVSAGDLFVALPGEKFDGHDYVGEALQKGAAACLVSRKMETKVPAQAALLQVSDTLAALQTLAGWHRKRLTGKVIAITGANGKTTTKTMLAHVLSGALHGQASPKSFNNHIGVPITLLSANVSDDFLVVEIGTNHLGEVAALARLVSPDVSIVTSVSESHLEGLGDLAGVAGEETSQLGFLRSGGVGFVNADHPLLLECVQKYRKGSAAKIVTFGLNTAADVVIHEVAPTTSGLSFSIQNQKSKIKNLFLPVPGRHNAVNAGAVWAAARELGLSEETIRERLATFSPPESRNNLIRRNGLTILDDCYNANPGSMKAALVTLRDLPATRRVFVCGDMLELGLHAERLHTELGGQIALAGVDLLLAVGPLGRYVTNACPDVPSRTYPSAAEAAGEIPGLVQSGDCVLLKGSRGIRLEVVREAILKETSKNPNAEMP